MGTPPCVMNKPPLRDDVASAPCVSVVKGEYLVNYVWHVPVDLRGASWYIKYGALHVLDRQTGTRESYLPVQDHGECDFKQLAAEVTAPACVVGREEIEAYPAGGGWRAIDEINMAGLSQRLRSL